LLSARHDIGLIGIATAIIKHGQLHIKTIIIDAYYRKQSIGSKLIKNIIEYGKLNGCTFVFVETFSF